MGICELGFRFGLMALFFTSLSLLVSGRHGFSIIFVINSLNMDLKSTTSDFHSVAERRCIRVTTLL
jgi:hypothetical protein